MFSRLSSVCAKPWTCLLITLVKIACTCIVPPSLDNIKRYTEYYEVGLARGQNGKLALIVGQEALALHQYIYIGTKLTNMTCIAKQVI